MPIDCFFPLFYWSHIWKIENSYRNFTSRLIEQTTQNVLKSCQICYILIYLQFNWHKILVKILFYIFLCDFDHNKEYFYEKILIKSKKTQLFFRSNLWISRSQNLYPLQTFHWAKLNMFFIVPKNFELILCSNAEKISKIRNLDIYLGEHFCNFGITRKYEDSLKGQSL